MDGEGETKVSACLIYERMADGSQHRHLDLRLLVRPWGLEAQRMRGCLVADGLGKRLWTGGVVTLYCGREDRDVESLYMRPSLPQR